MNTKEAIAAQANAAELQPQIATMRSHKTWGNSTMHSHGAISPMVTAALQGQGLFGLRFGWQSRAEVAPANSVIWYRHSGKQVASKRLSGQMFACSGRQAGGCSVRGIRTCSCSAILLMRGMRSFSKERKVSAVRPCSWTHHPSTAPSSSAVFSPCPAAFASTMF